MAYTTLDKVKKLLQADVGKIKISQEELVEGQKDHISEATIIQLITDIDAVIDVNLENRGISTANYTNALSFVATRLVAYEVYQTVYPRIGVNEMPNAVKGWKKDADDLLGKIGKGKVIGAQICDWKP